MKSEHGQSQMTKIMATFPKLIVVVLTCKNLIQAILKIEYALSLVISNKR